MSKMDYEFLGLMPGSFGELVFQKKAEHSKSYSEQYTDNFANQAMHAFIQDGILNPGKTQMNPIDAFNKARADAKSLLDKDGKSRFKITFQIGNKESMDELEKIENQIDFIGWENPGFIEMIKEDYKKGLENSNYPI